MRQKAPFTIGQSLISIVLYVLRDGTVDMVCYRVAMTTQKAMAIKILLQIDAITQKTQLLYHTQLLQHTVRVLHRLALAFYFLSLVHSSMLWRLYGRWVYAIIGSMELILVVQLGLQIWELRLVVVVVRGFVNFGVKVFIESFFFAFFLNCII